jgi:hypothetical protein
MGKLEVFNVEQGTAEWLALRAGVPTASEFATILAQGKGGAPSLIRKKYLYKLAAESYRGALSPFESYSNHHMQRGKDFEDEARGMYEITKNVMVEQVGFMMRDGVGCSPDGLVGEDGGIEIKTKSDHLMVEILLANEMPSDYFGQTQGFLYMTGRKWIDFVAYAPGLPLFIQRQYPDAEYQFRLAKEIPIFVEELQKIRAAIEAYHV